MDKVYAVWSVGECILVEGKPEINNDGHLEFKREDGVVSAIFSTWNSVRIQDKE